VEMEDSHFKISLHFEIVDFFLPQTFHNKTPLQKGEREDILNGIRNRIIKGLKMDTYLYEVSNSPLCTIYK